MGDWVGCPASFKNFCRTFWMSNRITPWQITHITLLVPWPVPEKGGTENVKWLHVHLISSYDCRTFRYYCHSWVKRAFTQRTNETLDASCGSPDSISFNHKLELVCDLQIQERSPLFFYFSQKSTVFFKSWALWKNDTFLSDVPAEAAFKYSGGGIDHHSKSGKITW